MAEIHPKNMQKVAKALTVFEIYGNNIIDGGKKNGKIIRKKII